MYRMILGTSDELQKILEIAKEPLDSTVKLVPLTVLAEQVTGIPHTKDWEALETLIDRAKDFRAIVEFLGIYKTLNEYLAGFCEVVHLKFIKTGHYESLPLIMIEGVVGVPIFINLIRYNIISVFKHFTPLSGKVKLGEDYVLDIPAHSSEFSPADVFGLSDVGKPTFNYRIDNFQTLKGDGKDRITKDFLNHDLKAILLGYKDKVPPHRRDVSI